jgi:2-amino-4-hydroxy-6-hydroxymethyldihydropteridine diphosphokinase
MRQTTPRNVSSNASRPRNQYESALVRATPGLSAFHCSAAAAAVAAHSDAATPAPSAASAHPAAAGATWKRCFVAIGSNAGHRARHLNAALALLRISAPSSLTLQATSFLYETTPVGSPPEHANQPRFLNAVLEVRTTLEPLALLDVLKDIEHRLGRDAHMVRNGPRVIDLDIISTPHNTSAHA